MRTTSITPRARLFKDYREAVIWDYIRDEWEAEGCPTQGIMIEWKMLQDCLERRKQIKLTHRLRAGFSDNHIGGLIRSLKNQGVLQVFKHGRKPRSYLPC